MGPTKLNGNHTNHKTRMWIQGEYATTQGALEVAVDLYGHNETLYFTEKGPLLLTPDNRWRALYYWQDFSQSEKKAMMYMIAKKNKAQRVLLEAKPKQLRNDDPVISALFEMQDEQTAVAPVEEEVAAVSSGKEEWRRKAEWERYQLKSFAEQKIAEAKWKTYEKQQQEAQERAARAQEAKEAWLVEFNEQAKTRRGRSATARR